MTHKTYNKLVRDKIPDIIAADGRQYATEIMSDEEYLAALKQKLVEEAQEVLEAESGSDLSRKLPMSMKSSIPFLPHLIFRPTKYLADRANSVLNVEAFWNESSTCGRSNQQE